VYECGKRNPLYPIRANSFVSIIMYLTCTIIVLLQKYMVWPQALDSFKKYMPPPLPYFKVNICPLPLPHFASIFFAYL
jgi:hypothetical protein